MVSWKASTPTDLPLRSVGPEMPLSLRRFIAQHLKAEQPNDDGSADIPWNFTKFLVDRSGSVVKRYSPTVTPEDIATELPTVL